MSAAEQLNGLKLDGGWTVAQRLQSQGSSGGIFSVPYLVHDSNDKPYFLKAFDFSSAFEPGVDVISELTRLTSAFEHERDVLEHCKARRLSAVVLAVAHGYVQVPGLAAQEAVTQTVAFSLHNARLRARRFQLDPYAWVDLALAYVVKGKNEAAKRSMSVALQLAPNDRHVLRSATRFYLHVGENERAHDIIKMNDATRSDPWLMAAEIALSGLAERKPAMFKRGGALINEGGIQPRHVSELASAIGTVHLMDGHRKARKLFNTSLLDPTGNSLAQAEWATPIIGGLVKPQTLARTADSAEAKVFQAYWSGNFLEVINECENWINEELFSSRPHQFASGAAITLEKFDVALTFTENGLKLNSDSVVLHNNRAYSLIALDRYDEAFSELTQCLSMFTEDSLGPITATAGMLAFRLGQVDEGIKRYNDAITIFRRSGYQVGEVLASVYFAQEAARADLPDAQKIIEQARILCKNMQHLPEAHIVLGRAEMWASAVKQRKIPMTSIEVN